VIISEDDQRYELDLGLRDALSSTLSGVGSAVARRAMRINVETIGMRARTDGWLRPFVCHVAEEVNAAASLGKKILIEGTQGFGLSVFHSSEFPKATSRDTTAAGFLSEVGVSPLLVSEIVMVLRTFPIRVAGIQAGTLKNETTWEALERESKYPHSIAEFTSVTKKLRRVARFDWELASEAVRYNRPTRLAINGLDYLDFDNYRVTSVSKLSGKAMSFLNDVASRLLVPIGYYGTSPYLDDVIAPATAPQSYAWGSPDDRHFTSVD
jgi:adenylosuccinate synthase